jgi:DNA polymerase III sliding clamp (beta) subunit (PCNA family)
MLYSKKIKELYPKDLMFNVKVIKLMRLFPGLSYRISQQKLNLIAESDDVTIRWRGNDGNYPNWQSVVIVHPNKVIIPVKETINALDAVAFAVNDASHLVKWKISGNKLELSGTDRDFGISSSESVNIINPDNNEIEWGFKLDFIRKELETLFEEGFAQVDVRFEDNTKSILLADRLLLMPMMITD